MDRKTIKYAIKNHIIDFNYDLSRYSAGQLKLLKTIKTRLKQKLLPKLKFGQSPLIKDFAVVFANCGQDYLGVYINGSYTYKPIILVDLNNTVKCGKEDNTYYGWIIETTILHELAHAIQDILGLEFDETQAEDFAYNYKIYGEILDLSKKKFAMVS